MNLRDTPRLPDSHTCVTLPDPEPNHDILAMIHDKPIKNNKNKLKILLFIENSGIARYTCFFLVWVEHMMDGRTD